MQSVTRSRTRARPAGTRRTDRGERRVDLAWAVSGIAALVVAAGAVTTVASHRYDTDVYTADLSDAGALRVGDQVRLAGIVVGSVKSLVLADDHVVMRFAVERGVFLGAQTTLDIRMSSIVGGHYVALSPAGAQPLGAAAIPADHVTLPYSLPDAFADAITPLRQVDGATLRANFTALDTALDQSPDSVRRVLDATDSIVSILQQQNAEISRSLSFTDEYLAALAQNKSVVGRLIAKFRLLETIIENNGDAVGTAMHNLGLAASQLAPVARAWNTDAAPIADTLKQAIDDLGQLAAHLGTLLDSTRTVEDRLTTLIGPDPADGAVAPCLPTPGKAC